MKWQKIHRTFVNLFIFCQKIIDQKEKMFLLCSCQVHKFFCKFLRSCRIFIRFIEKISRMNFQKITDIKERTHGRKRFSVFDFIDITFALPE